MKKTKRLYNDKYIKRVQNVVGLILVFGIWFVLSNYTDIPNLYLPSPQEIIACFIKYSEDIPRHIISSMYRIVIGFSIGSLLGILMGLMIGWSKNVRNTLEPLVEFIRPMPPLALIPLFILWFGIGNKSKIIVIAFGAWVVLVVNTIEAVRNVDPLYIDAAKSLGAKTGDILRTVLIPAITPEIIAGIRVVAANSFGMCVAAEFMGTEAGFGYMIIEGRRFIMTDLLLVGVLLITIYSMLVNGLIKLIERRITKWVPRREE
jgi:ABC-type nitrate/sulfonate/bicarbonate transport system, permease component